MSYSTIQNVTPIEMLPDLEDLERENFNSSNQQLSMQTETNMSNNTHYLGEKMLPPGEADKFGRYIRGNHKIPQQSGMASYNDSLHSQQTRYYPKMEKNGNHFENNLEMDFDGINNSQPKYILPEGSPSCIDVANHIESCPICSKYYDNNNTIYIITIIFLSIICILLLKKVLDI